MANQVVYGFHSLIDVFNQRVQTVGVDLVNTAIDQAMAEHNRQLTAMTALFVRPTTQFQVNYRSVQVTRNQPLDEFGRPLPIKGFAQYQVAFPLIDSGNAFAYNWQTGLAATVEELNNTINAIQMGDFRWVFDHILAALFANTSYTYYDPEHGPLTVLGLANGDTQAYNVFAGGDLGATDNHYLAQANAIATGVDNPFAAIYQELNEHPENGGGGRVIALVATNLKSAITGLPTFNPLPMADIRPGANSDVLVGDLGVNVPGTVLGMDDSGVWIVEQPRLPTGYMVAIKTGGDPPLTERQSTIPELQGGLVEAPRNENWPWYQRNFVRKTGYGGWNRVAALVYRVGNASYAVPTNYASPMP
jgi:hypothetical protein